MNLLDTTRELMKQLIKRNVDSYSGPWRLIHEAIQNADDAIQMKGDLNDREIKGVIAIDLFVGSNIVRVMDNGCGIPYSQKEKLLQLAASEKLITARKVKGSQGVGIKSTMYSSDHFLIETRTSDEMWGLEMNNLCNYDSVDFTGEVPDPICQPNPDPRTGTKIQYRVVDYTVLDFINEIAEVYGKRYKISKDAFDIETFGVALTDYFLKETYLGCVDNYLTNWKNNHKINVRLTVYFDYDQSFLSKNENRWLHTFLTKQNEPYQVHFNNGYKDHEPIINEAIAQLLFDKDDIYTTFEDALNPDSESLGVNKLFIKKFTKDELELLLYDAEKSGKKYSLVRNEEKIKENEEILRIANGAFMIITSLPIFKETLRLVPEKIISLNGLISASRIAIPQKGMMSYHNHILFILDLNAEGGYAKTKVDDRIKRLSDNLYSDSWSLLRKVTTKIVGRDVDKDEKRNPDDPGNLWNMDEVINEYKNVNKTHVLPGFPIIPREEQDILGLFTFMVGAQYIKGYQLTGFGSNKKYDGTVILDKGGELKKRVKTIELKMSVADLVKDIHLNRKKKLSEIDILIAYDMGDIKKADPSYSLRRDPRSPYPHADYKLTAPYNQECWVILLSSVIAEYHGKTPKLDRKIEVDTSGFEVFADY